TLLYGVIYKWLNPKGLLYLKLDMNLQKSTQDDLFKFSDHILKEKAHQKMLKIFMKQADILSVETRQVRKKVQPFFNLFDKELLYLPNGLNYNYIRKIKKDKTIKENIILTAGRIGSAEKNHEQLLDALSGIELNDWEVYFVGPVEKSFQTKIETFFDNNPD